MLFLVKRNVKILQIFLCCFCKQITSLTALLHDITTVISLFHLWLSAFSHVFNATNFLKTPHFALLLYFKSITGNTFPMENKR